MCSGVNYKMYNFVDKNFTKSDIENKFYLNTIRIGLGML